MHGTTVVTNTILTREGARVGLLTTKGFRDVLAIAHQARPLIYDDKAHRVDPLIDDEFITEVAERINADGEIVKSLDDELEEVAEQIRTQKLDAVVVSFLNAYANSKHEVHAAKRLEELDVAPIVSAATSITAEMREYDRASTAAINAYVRPIVSGYMGRFKDNIEELGIPAPLWVMQSNGGLLNPKMASTHSARTVLSGLARGVVGAVDWARHLDLDKVASFISAARARKLR